MNAQQTANEERINRNAEWRRDFQAGSGMDDATFEMMEAQQRADTERRSRENRRTATEGGAVRESNRPRPTNPGPRPTNSNSSKKD